MDAMALVVTLVVVALVGLACLAVGILLGQRMAAKAQADVDNQLQALATQAAAASRQQTAELTSARLAVTEQMVAPVQDGLRRLTERLSSLETNEASWRSAVREQVEAVRLGGAELRRETQALAVALRQPQVRGHWGEMQLRRSLELAGLTSRCAFLEQATRQTEDGRLRPDAVISMPGDKSVVVDSKAPLDAFLAAGAAEDPDLRASELQRHARQVRSHVDSLAAKAYWQHFNPTPEFVVLFLPGEAIFAQALDTDPGLIDYAAGKGVILATPTTLIAMLKTVGYAWTQEALTENAREVTELGRELYERLGTVGGHLDKLGRALTTAVQAYNSAIGSVEQRVLVSARRMRDLQVTDAPLDRPATVSEPTRPMTAPELVDDGGISRVIPIEGPPGKEQLGRAIGE
ncbi:MAG TPA: DNA recombination protein RmuC [Nocardioidaceae bacterium]|nr:DNA recombination protein RmuC [Nocardioidaceae bacterium]